MRNVAVKDDSRQQVDTTTDKSLTFSMKIISHLDLEKQVFPGFKRAILLE